MIRGPSVRNMHPGGQILPRLLGENQGCAVWSAAATVPAANALHSRSSAITIGTQMSRLSASPAALDSARPAYRWFLGIDLDESVPDHSALSQLRHRKFNNTAVFEEIFTEIVRQCIEYGLIDGKLLLTDSTHVRANAHKNQIHYQVPVLMIRVKPLLSRGLGVLRPRSLKLFSYLTNIPGDTMMRRR